MGVKFLRGLKANLDTVVVVADQILFTTDTKEMFIDTSEGRIEIADTQALANAFAQYQTTNDAAVKKIGDDFAAYVLANDGAIEVLGGNITDLAEFVGTLPEGATAATIVDYINEKTAGIATDTALTELQEAVDALEEEAAKHALKKDVEAMYTNEQIDALVQGAKDYADANDADTKYGITYDSKTKTIKLVEGGTALEIDATAFIKDGMIESATLDDNSDLVITFNTEAGKDAIVLPLDKLIDVYTGKTTDDIIVTINGNEINATLTEAVKASLAKADVAEQNAKGYADGLNTAMGARVKDLEDNKTGYATTGQVASAKQEAINAAATDAAGKANAAQAAAEKKAAELDTALHTTISAEIDQLAREKVDESQLTSAVETALTEAKASGAFNGTNVTVTNVTESTADGGNNVVTFSNGSTLTVKNGSKGSAGERGTGLLSVTTAPSSYTTEVGGITPKYRMEISTIKSQADVAEVLLGDTVRYSYYQYPIDYLDTNYAYFTTRISVRGTAGTSITVSSVTESTESGGSNIVTFSDNKTVTIKNGKDYVLTEADKEEIAAIAASDTHTIPDYWLSALENGAEAINTALCTAGRNKSAFLFYTDAHWGYGSGMSPKLLKYLGKHTGINKTIFGGDFGNTYENPDTGKTMDDWADVMREWKLAIRDIPNHHSVVGNHDKEVDAFNTDKSLYGFLFAPEETNDIVRGGDFFYYIDDVNEKTRYFYLNTGLTDFSDEQCKFLIDGLTSVPAGWHIVAVSHIWFVYDSTDTPTVGSVPTNIQKVLNLLDSYNLRSFGSVTIASEAYDYDFSKCEGWFEFCIGGHTHVDHSFTSAMGIPIILCPTDSKHTRGADKFVAGTTSEACVSGIIADYDNRTINVVRVGRGASREVELTWYEVSYNNILSTALAADGVNIYNGKGWQEDRRWSQSQQKESDSTGTYLTGWIKVSKGDVIYLKNIITPSSNFTLLRSNSPGSTSGSWDYNNIQTDINGIVGDDGNIIQFSWNRDESYFRIMCNGISDASIITKNEPIE